MADERVLSLLSCMPLFAGVSPQTLAFLGARLRHHSFRRGQVIVRQDEPAHTLHVITAGRVKIARETEEGDETLLGLDGQGACIGDVSVLDGGSRSATVTAVEPTETFALLREDLLAVLRDDPEFALAIISTLASRLRRAESRLEDAYFTDLEVRLARRLLQLAEEHGRKTAAGVEVPLPITQAELASMLGAGRPRVNSLLGEFQDAGLLRLDKGSFTVLQPDALRRRAAR